MKTFIHPVLSPKLIQKGWQKAVQAYKGDLVKGLKIDKKTLDKIPKELGDTKLAGKNAGLRWGDDKAKNCIRIQKGDPNAPYPHQQVDYVRITSNGKVVDKKGMEIAGEKIGVKTKENPDVHIPLSEWKNWKEWNQP